MFAERFHMDVKLVNALNPGIDLMPAGSTIVVADIRGQPVTGKITRIEADKARATGARLRCDGAAHRRLSGDDRQFRQPFALRHPPGERYRPDPVYYYNPKNFVQGKNTGELQLPPGPNNPVGTMWIDLSEPSYGIHGTPEPSKIDKTGSHGCVRLTNWDAEELSTLVTPGVIVEFLE